MSHSQIALQLSPEERFFIILNILLIRPKKDYVSRRRARYLKLRTCFFQAMFLFFFFGKKIIDNY